MGQIVYQAPETHVCPKPPINSAVSTVGSIWQCDCGRYYRFEKEIDGSWWAPLTARKARRLLGELGLL